MREISDLADDCDFDAMTFLHTLADLETSDPAEHVFDRIRQRIIHAVEREQEERHAARTKESINLAEYPDSFEVASRMPRRFIALLGPTNSGKTHRAMEALMKAPSGVYLAPLRLLALENFERMQAARPHGKRAQGQPGHRRGTPAGRRRDPRRQHRRNARFAHRASTSR